MYTIFKNDCVFKLTDNLDIINKSGFFKWDEINFNKILHSSKPNCQEEYYIFHENLDYLWNQFKKYFVTIHASGGVVFNKRQDILFIYRLGKWDLPKGKIEIGEDIKTAALREVKEECGITDLVLKKFITDTYHIYTEKNKQYLKIVSWYKMFSNSTQLKPQTEEDITKVIWKNHIDVKKAMQNTYPNILLLLNRLEQFK